MSLHIIFADGSNPYIRYNMDPVEFAQEVLKWAENFDLVFDKAFGESIIQLKATAKGTPKSAVPTGEDEPF